MTYLRKEDSKQYKRETTESKIEESGKIKNRVDILQQSINVGKKHY